MLYSEISLIFSEVEINQVLIIQLLYRTQLLIEMKDYTLKMLLKTDEKISEE